MSSSNPGQGSLDSFFRPNTPATAEISAPNPAQQTLQPPPRIATPRSPSPAKRAREDNEAAFEDGSDSSDEDEEEGEEETNDDAMDFQPTKHITETQTIGGDTYEFANTAPQMGAPMSHENAALRADFEIITNNVMEQLYRTISVEIKQLFAKNNATIHNATNELSKQISSLGTWITQVQQQLLSTTRRPAPSVKPTGARAPTNANPKQERRRKGKRANNNNADNNKPNTTTNTHPTTRTYADAAKTPTAQPQSPTEQSTHATNVEGWENLRKRSQGKNPAPPNLVPTMYPQAEREVTCQFPAETPTEAGARTERSYSARQAISDAALHRVNKALVDNQDVTAPPFLCAQVTMRGSIVLTTGNTQNNNIYEDYATIISSDAFSYYRKCENVEIGKHFSQFLLHSVPTHHSLPDISNSIATNYPQLTQGQTLRRLTPSNRREQKSTSTIVMTLTGSVMMADIRQHYLPICKRECQLNDYISYRRSTQCHNCQDYGHPVALCRNPSHCAVCAEAHETKDHPCTIPLQERSSLHPSANLLHQLPDPPQGQGPQLP